MHWFADENQIGDGSILDGPKLPPGIHKIRLEATDAQGRLGSMTVNVEVLKVPTVPTALNWRWIAIIGLVIVFIFVLIIVLRRRTAG
jgi:hypothetical protein